MSGESRLSTWISECIWRWHERKADGAFIMEMVYPPRSMNVSNIFHGCYPCKQRYFLHRSWNFGLITDSKIIRDHPPQTINIFNIFHRNLVISFWVLFNFNLTKWLWYRWHGICCGEGVKFQFRQQSASSKIFDSAGNPARGLLCSYLFPMPTLEGGQAFFCYDGKPAIIERQGGGVCVC